VSLQPAASQPSLAKSFRYDSMAAKIGMESSIHIFQSCIDFMPSRRLPLEALASCDWCRLAEQAEAVKTVSEGVPREVWEHSALHPHPRPDIQSAETATQPSISPDMSQCKSSVKVKIRTGKEERVGRQRQRVGRKREVLSREEEEDSPRTITVSLSQPAEAGDCHWCL
jgi:hypothetical protein